MKVVKLIIQNDDGVEETLIVKDGAGLFVCEGSDAQDKVLTTSTANPAINLQIIKNVLA